MSTADLTLDERWIDEAQARLTAHRTGQVQGIDAGTLFRGLGKSAQINEACAEASGTGRKRAKSSRSASRARRSCHSYTASSPNNT